MATQVMAHLPQWRTSCVEFDTKYVLKTGEVIRIGDLVTIEGTTGNLAPALAVNTVGTTTAILGISMGDSVSLMAAQETANPTIPILIADDELEILLPLVNSSTNTYDAGTWAATLTGTNNYCLTRQAAANTQSCFCVDIKSTNSAYPIRILGRDTEMTSAVAMMGWADASSNAYTMVWCKIAEGNRIRA